MGNATIDIIYTLLKNSEQYENEANCEKCTQKDNGKCKKKNGCKWLYISEENGGHILWGIKYLLGQIIRQVGVPDDRKHLSEKALEKWKKLGLEENDIWNYNYQDKITVDTPVCIESFKGSEKESTTVEINGKGDFAFNDVFHDEHIVPIHDILKELLDLSKDKLTKDKIAEYLDKIHICRILKSEDKAIHPSYNRGYELDYKKIYENIYKNAKDKKGNPTPVIIPDIEEEISNERKK